MKTRLVSFATREFDLGLSELLRSARENGVDEAYGWDPDRLRATSFYRAHRAILDQRRGAGYWLWKPYIIKDALERAEDGDVVIYADAAVTILRPLDPLISLCRAQGGVLLFAGHYDGIGGRPNTCETWTKRDCFVLMGCDEPRYYTARMIDAAFLVFAKTPDAMRIVEEWLTLCTDTRIVTDARGATGRPERPGFIDHRHDQSVLALLAARDGLELFRSPSQFGNHCKRERLREPGEWVRQPYGAERIYENSPYPTLTFHHRMKRLGAALPASAGVAGPRSYIDLLTRSAGSADGLRVLRLGNADEPLDALRRALPGAALIARAGRAWDQLSGPAFHLVVSSSREPAEVLDELQSLARRRLLALPRFLVCWDHLEGIEGWRAFRALLTELPRHFDPHHTFTDLGLVLEDAGGPVRTVGLVAGRQGSIRNSSP